MSTANTRAAYHMIATIGTEQETTIVSAITAVYNPRHPSAASGGWFLIRDDERGPTQTGAELFFEWDIMPFVIMATQSHMTEKVERKVFNRETAQDARSDMNAAAKTLFGSPSEAPISETSASNASASEASAGDKELEALAEAMRQTFFSKSKG